MSKYLRERALADASDERCARITAICNLDITMHELDALATVLGHVVGRPEEHMVESLLRKLAPGHTALTERARIAAETERGEWPVGGAP